MIDIHFLHAPDNSDCPICLPVAASQDLAEILPAAALPFARAIVGRFTGEAGSIIRFAADLDGRMRSIVLFGIGDKFAAQEAGSALVAKYLLSGEKTLQVDLRHLDTGDRGEFAVAMGEAARLRSWRHDVYRTGLTEVQRPRLDRIEIIVGDQQDRILEKWGPRAALCDGVALARELVAEPGNVIYPESFVERCAYLAERGVVIEVLDRDAMQALGMGALLGVAQGSRREPRLLCMRWCGSEAPPIALVGKGVTFDTGGISIKPSAGMEAMKWDMAGAAAVAGAMHALAARKAPAHVIGVCALAENMPDGNAMRPGDVLSSMSGKTIEVINTDAEGRLVLADAITWVQRRYAPETIVDVATLTGAIIVGLGREFAGLFTAHDDLADRLAAAGVAAGEHVWRMPLSPAYDKLIDSKIADIKNAGSSEAGATTAAQFVGRFVENDVKWAHLDIAAMAWSEAPGILYDAGATGFGVKLLNQFVAE